MKIGEDYKKKYILLEIENKTQKNILIEALKDYISKQVEVIESYSKSDSHIRGADDIKRTADVIATCMEWRDKMHIMGSDTWPNEFDFYKHGIERII